MKKEGIRKIYKRFLKGILIFALLFFASLFCNFYCFFALAFFIAVFGFFEPVLFMLFYEMYHFNYTDGFLSSFFYTLVLFVIFVISIKVKDFVF